MQNIQLERGPTVMRINHDRVRECDDDVDKSCLDCTQLVTSAPAWVGGRSTGEFHHTASDCCAATIRVGVGIDAACPAIAFVENNLEGLHTARWREEANGIPT